jgi:hypothetical protein
MMVIGQGICHHVYLIYFEKTILLCNFVDLQYKGFHVSIDRKENLHLPIKKIVDVMSTFNH